MLGDYRPNRLKTFNGVKGLHEANPPIWAKKHNTSQWQRLEGGGDEWGGGGDGEN